MTSRPALRPIRSPRQPSLAESQLRGGLHAIAVRRPSVPLVELRIAFPLSPEQVARSAAPLVLSESVLAGTEHYDREGLAMAIERLGGTLHATLAGDQLQLIASALSDRLADLLALIADVLTGATYPAAEVRADRARTADEVVVLLSMPETIADEAFGRRLFGKHPYGAYIPRPSSLLRVGAPSLQRLHRVVLEPKSAHLVLVGDIQPKRALSLTEDALGDWLRSRGRAVAPLPHVPPVRPGTLELVHRPGSVQSNIRIGTNGPARSDADWPATSLANQILGGMFTSRLVTNLREKNGYAYSPGSSVEHRRAGSTFRLRAEVSTVVTAAALAEARYELARIATAGVSEDELEAARKYAIGTFLLQTASQAGLASTLAAWAVTGTGPDYLRAYPSAVARITRSEVDEAARRYFAPSRMATVVVGDADAVAAPLSVLDAVTVK